ncbi:MULTISPECIES: Mu transposase C-terminal domain-containing protein [unclassified Thalassospira]|uniref:Mu transposase C-terminal domain-containing protein n=1 Tax=unclassified Thalassospira TaxID=2648997 RepID=UPI001B0444EF|nr:Mu transposase C-terminal domain-containing protein [Thalassospira sp.]MBO6773532.1 DDE-type integrase/transposase/recombinase [Thalassospira sp.]
MSMIYIPVNTRVCLDAEVYKVVCHTESDELNLTCLRTGKPLLISARELAEKVVEGEASIDQQIPEIDTSPKGQLEKRFDAFSESDKAVARERLSYINKVDELLISSNLTTAINEVIEGTERDGKAVTPSFSAIWRWYNDWLKGGRDITALVPRHHLKGRKPTCMCNRSFEILQEVVEDHYLVRTPKNKLGIFKLFKSRLMKENKRCPEAGRMHIPSSRSIYRFLAGLNPYEVMAAQKGRRQADKVFAGVGPGIVAKFPLHIVQVDHQLMDIILRTKDGKVIGRPWLTLALDLYSRMPVGFYVSFESPGYVSVMHCLKHAILPKEEYLKQVLAQFKAQPGTTSDANFASIWPCFGVMDTLVLDNALEFHSQDLLDSCSQLAISVEYNPARTPHYKGAVERFFGTLNTKLIHTLPGTTFSNPEQRGDYNSGKSACLTIEDLEFLLTKFIVDEHAVTEHSTLKQLPLEKWQNGVREHPVRFISSQQDVAVLLFKVKVKKLTRTGIRIMGLNYQSHSLQLLRQRLMTNSSGKFPNPEVRIKFDPEDLATIHVEDSRAKLFIPVNCTLETYALQLSIWRHRLIRRAMLKRELDLRKASEDDFLEMRQSLFEVAEELIESRQKRKRKAANRFTSEEKKAGNDNGPLPKTEHTIDEQTDDISSDETFASPFHSPEELEDELKRRGWRTSRAGDPNQGGGETDA